MAATDITLKDTWVPGVNQDTHYQKQTSFVIDCAEHSGLLTTATHNLVKLNKGDMLTQIRIVVLTAAASSGSATVQFKALFNNTSEAINSSAIGKANLAAGDVYDLPVSGIKGYDRDYPPVIQMVVAGADLTAFKFLLITEAIPVQSFIDKG